MTNEITNTTINLKFWLHQGKLWTYIKTDDKKYVRIVPLNQVKELTAQEVLDLL